MGNKPVEFQHNAMCVQISTAIPSVKNEHIFHPFMVTTVLTANGETACNLIFGLPAAVRTVSDQQTKTECCGTNM